jgi:hypothetical protein
VGGADITNRRDQDAFREGRAAPEMTACVAGVIRRESAFERKNSRALQMKRVYR